MRYSIFVIVIITPLLICNYFLENYLGAKRCFFQCGMWLLFVISLWRGSVRVPRRIYIPGAFFLWASLCALMSSHPVWALSKVAFWLAGGGFLLLLRQFCMDMRRGLFIVFLAVVDLVALGCVVQWLGYQPFPVVAEGFYGSTLGNPNFVATYVAAMAVALFGYLGNNDGKRLWLLLANWLFLVFVLVLTGSRGGFAAFLCGCGVFFCLRLCQNRSYKTVLMPLSLVLVAMLLAFLPLRYGMWNKPWNWQNYNSLHERVMMWTSTWRTISESPVVGHGPGLWQRVAYRQRTQFLAEPGHEMYLQAAKNSFFRHAHNDYLEIAAALGWPGLLLFLILIGMMLYRGYTSPFSHHSHLAAVVTILAHALVSFPLQTAAGYSAFLLHWHLVFDSDSPTNTEEWFWPKSVVWLAIFVFAILALLLSMLWGIGNLRRVS